MPYTTNNIRRVFWDPDNPSEFEVRWREVNSTNWNVTTVIVPEIIFGVNVVGEPLPNTSTYAAILDLGKEYEFQVRHKCSPTSFSAWGATHTFNTYLPCPEGGTGGFAINVVADPNVLNGVEVQWGFDAKGSLVWPKMYLYYRPSGTTAWTITPYTPRDGNNMFLQMPSGGTWEYKVVIECKPGVAVYESAVATFNIVGTLPPPIANGVKPFHQGARFKWNAPSNPPSPVLYYEYRVDAGAWTNIGLVNEYEFHTLPSAAPAAHTIDLRAVYASGASTHVTYNFTTVAQLTNFDILGTQSAVSPWTTTPTDNYSDCDNTNLPLPTGIFGCVFHATGLTPNTQYGFSTLLNNHIIGRVYDATNQCFPKVQKSWNINTVLAQCTITLGMDGIFRVNGTLTSDGSGNIDLPLAGNYAI